jgi:enolase-phosphatase E1
VTAAPSATAIVLDIEGTTTPISFVQEVLFPFARGRVRPFLESRAHSPELRQTLEALNREYRADVASGLRPPSWQTVDSWDDATAYLHWLMDRDRKSTALKQLQGEIWEQGYQAGALKGVVFDDVPQALERWSRHERRVAIFSSGSVLAQKLLFAHSTAGDLSRFISAYFDTTLGPKAEIESYRRIGSALGRPADSIAFVSDVARELAAACASGMQTFLAVRPGNSRQEDNGQHRQIRSLLEVPD